MCLEKVPSLGLTQNRVMARLEEINLELRIQPWSSHSLSLLPPPSLRRLPTNTNQKLTRSGVWGRLPSQTMAMGAAKPPEREVTRVPRSGRDSSAAGRTCRRPTGGGEARKHQGGQSRKEGMSWTCQKWRREVKMTGDIWLLLYLGCRE